MSFNAMKKYLSIFNRLVEDMKLNIAEARTETFQILQMSQRTNPDNLDYQLTDSEMESLEKTTLRSWLEILEKKKLFYKASFPIAHRARMTQYLNAYADLLEGRGDISVTIFGDTKNPETTIQIWDTEISGTYNALKSVLEEMIVDPAPLLDK